MPHPPPCRPALLLLRPLLALGMVLGATAGTVAAADPTPTAVHPQWQAWTPGVWQLAQAQHRLVLLEVGARWCHWCQVMEHTTYADPAVVAALAAHYLCVHVDQAERPDIANRYEDYGWPATIIFRADGQELVKRRGYLPPAEMRALLAAVVADPTPGPSVRPAQAVTPAAAPGLAPADRAALLARFREAYDPQLGGWGSEDKYLDADVIEEAWNAADDGDAGAAAMATTTLAQAHALIDPVWGGVCQYSVGDWHHLHYERIAQVQADALRIYALAWARDHRPEDRAAAVAVHGFIQRFLAQPGGGYAASQDADVVAGVESTPYYALDDAHRRARGLPGIDTQRFAREQGWMIRALADASAALGDEVLAQEAEAAATWTLATRWVEGQGFRHDVHDAPGAYLGDTLAMGQGLLALHRRTGEARWLQAAITCRQVIDGRFRRPEGGYATGTRADGLPIGPERDENLQLARFACALAEQTADPQDRACAAWALRYAESPVLMRQAPAAGTLRADADWQGARVRVLVCGEPAAPEVQRAAATAIGLGLTRVTVLRRLVLDGPVAPGSAASATLWVAQPGQPWRATDAGRLAQDVLVAR